MLIGGPDSMKLMSVKEKLYPVIQRNRKPALFDAPQPILL